jgi:hypothetical protein
MHRLAIDLHVGTVHFGRTLILPDFFPYSPGFILYYIQYSKSVKMNKFRNLPVRHYHVRFLRMIMRASLSGYVTRNSRRSSTIIHYTGAYPADECINVTLDCGYGPGDIP